MQEYLSDRAWSCAGEGRPGRTAENKRYPYGEKSGTLDRTKPRKGTTRNAQTHGTTTILRLRRLPPRPGAAHRRHFSRAGRLGHHAHRGRQVHVLSDPGAAPAGADAGRLAPHLLDEGPSGGAQRRGHPGGLAQQLVGRGVLSGDLLAAPAGDAQAPVRRPGAAGKRGLSAAHAGAGDLHDRRGRGPLRVPVGAGFPAQLFKDPRLRGPAAPPPGGVGLYGHGHGGGPGGHRPAAGADRPGEDRDGLRPAQPLFRGPASHPEAPAADPAGGGPGRAQRHHLLRHPRQRGKGL